MKHENTISQQVDLRSLDFAALSGILRQRASVLASEAESLLVEKAIEMAARLHREDSRPVVRPNGEREVEEYILHPLRNTVHLLGWGVEDVNTLIASVLHDVVEDHPFEIARVEKGSRKQRHDNEMRAREIAFEHIEAEFNSEVAGLVKAMSNPVVRDFFKKSQDERNEIYVQHVQKEVLADVRVFAMKFADFQDNALAPVYDVPDAASQRRARKYLGLVPVFQEAVARHRQGGLLHSRGWEFVTERVNGAQEHLSNIIAASD